MGDEFEPKDDAPVEDGSRRVRDAARRTDSRPALVATAKFIRNLLPGDTEYGDALSTSGERLPEHLGRLVAETRSERPSAVRELGLGVLQAWQALSETQRRGRGSADVAILFTDLVGFSSWALRAGDEATVELLRKVGTAEQAAIAAHAGILVKRLGDGAMAVFGLPREAVEAAFDLQGRLAGIEVQGYTPELRAGVHLGRPRKVGRDYLGVDVNIAARVGECAKGGEVLVSESAREALDADGLAFGRGRRLKAQGVPQELVVRPVRTTG